MRGKCEDMRKIKKLNDEVLELELGNEGWRRGV
jgi:hypothetical protein